jgi:hypothetical protein
LVLESQGKYEKTEGLHRRALEGRQKILDLKHQDALISARSFDLVLGKQGKYKEAKALHRRGLEGSERGARLKSRMHDPSLAGYIIECPQVLNIS